MRASVWLWCGIAFMMNIAIRVTFCTPSGLNNIPTADVVNTSVLVFQQMNNLRVGGFQGKHVLAFKYGITPNAELGWVGAPKHSGSRRDFLMGVGAAASYPTTFHGKLRMTIQDNLQLGVGVINLSNSSRKAGHPVYYMVVSQDFKWARGHLGYMTTKGPDGLFVGLDKTVGRWTLRTDFNDVGTGSVTTVGFLRPLSVDWVLEGWLSFPTQQGIKETVTIKLNYVVKL